MSEDSKSAGASGTFSVVMLLAILKLSGAMQISWYWVFSPVLISLSFIMVAALIVVAVSAIQKIIKDG